MRAVCLRLGFAAMLAFALTAAPGAQQAGESRTQGASPEQIAPSPSFSGSELYRTYCVACHGRSAKGDGPLAEHMKKRPPDLTLIAARNGGTFPAAMVFRIVDGRHPVAGHGGPDMPVWGDVFKQSRDGSSEESVKARIEALVEHLESLQQKAAPADGQGAGSTDRQ